MTEQTESKHTPAPWHVEPEQATLGHGLAICSAENGWIIATITPEDGRELDATDQANARLLAAAPDLLSCLRYAYGILGRLYDGEAIEPDEIGSALQPSSDALSAATGEVAA